MTRVWYFPIFIVISCYCDPTSLSRIIFIFLLFPHIFIRSFSSNVAHYYDEASCYANTATSENATSLKEVRFYHLRKKYHQRSFETNKSLENWSNKFTDISSCNNRKSNETFGSPLNRYLLYTCVIRALIETILRFFSTALHHFKLELFFYFLNKMGTNGKSRKYF